MVIIKTVRIKTTVIRTEAFVDDDSEKEGTWYRSDIK